ncbi:MAG: DUF6473 family protein [Microcoleaceae cyanobacterium]
MDDQSFPHHLTASMGYYQSRDWEIIDYHSYILPGTELAFRGPELQSLEKDQYFVCIGAAQTFGCFCEQPYPNLLQKWLDLPVLNLGYGGAGPYFFLSHDALISYMNQAKFVIVQVMSGRSESNSLFESGGLEHLTRNSDGRKIGSEPAYQELLEQHGEDYARLIIAETRLNWVNNFQLLLQKIQVPKLLLWFSQRSPSYVESYENIYTVFGQFPQLVNAQMIEKVRHYSDDYIECISNRGMPQLLISRFTGLPQAINLAYEREDLGDKSSIYNDYYFSPEMQRDAATLLLPRCQQVLELRT